jgi:WD40 repeat protein
MGTTYGFSLAFAPNNQKIAVGGSNAKLQTYKLSDGSLDLNITNAHASWVTTVAYSSDSYWIASGGSDDKVKLWDNTGVLLKTFSHTEDVTSLKFSPDNQRLFSASKDNTIKVWELSTGNLLQTITVSAKDVNAIDLSPDGQMLVSASADSLLRIWNTNDYQLVSTFGIQDSGQYICVAWSPLGDKIAAGTEEGSGVVIVYDVSALTDIERALSAHQISISPNPIVEKSLVHFPVNTVQSLEVFDLTGKRIEFYSNLLQKEEVFLENSNLPKGYLIGQFITKDNQVLVCHFWVR